MRLDAANAAVNLPFHARKTFDKRGLLCIFTFVYVPRSVAVRFTWDAAKEARNRAKHGLDFSFAEMVFCGPATHHRFRSLRRWR
jgi:hypothetical protein